MLRNVDVRANASKHKTMSYGRMVTEEARLTAEVKRLLTQAEAADAQDDATYGLNRRGDELPAELARREQRLQTIRAAKVVLEQEAQAEATLTQAAHAARATSRIRKAGSCQRQTPRGVSCKGITVKRPSMRPRRSSSPLTSPMKRMTSRKPSRC
ncbi:MAG: hypothetical protein P0120_23465 [Nitrospira sp.]|nr:hypothetical protein [Nitrospira sp.]